MHQSDVEDANGRQWRGTDEPRGRKWRENENDVELLFASIASILLWIGNVLDVEVVLETIECVPFVSVGVFDSRGTSLNFA